MATEYVVVMVENKRSGVMKECVRRRFGKTNKSIKRRVRAAINSAARRNNGRN
jgi:hypothetical protein